MILKKLERANPFKEEEKIVGCLVRWGCEGGAARPGAQGSGNKPFLRRVPVIVRQPKILPEHELLHTLQDYIKDKK